MAFAKITLSDGINIKTIPVGISWSCLFLGCIVPFWRQEWVIGFLYLGLSMISSAAQYAYPSLNPLWMGLSLVPVMWFVFCFNQWHLRKLILKEEYFVLSLNNQITDAKLREVLGIVTIPYAPQ